MSIEDVERGHAAPRPGIDPPTVSSPVIWTQGKVNLHDSEKSPAKPQITLLHVGLHPIGKGALVMTGGPGGDGADRGFRRDEVALCIMWLAAAVTVSLLSPPSPTAPVICGRDFASPLFLPGTAPVRWNCGEWRSCETRLCLLSVFIHFPPPKVLSSF